MLIEKTIRKKKISPFYLEMASGLIFNEFLALIVILGSLIFDGFHLIWIVIFIVLGVLSAYLTMHHVLSIVRHLKSDKKGSRIITQDITFVDYDFSFAASRNYSGYFYTFTHLFYTEPYIRIVIFNYLPAERIKKPIEQLKFHMEEVSITCRRQKEYQKYRAEYKQYENAVKNRRIYEIPEKTIREYKDANHTILYMTYDKMQAFNKLFELVNPPEFRITKYETSWVFISIEPIPGKEYPSEALECMEKINAMYP